MLPPPPPETAALEFKASPFASKAVKVNTLPSVTLAITYSLFSMVAVILLEPKVAAAEKVT